MKLLSAIDDAPINEAYLWNSGRAKPIARVSTKVLARARMCLKPTSTVHKQGMGKDRRRNSQLIQC